MKTITIAEKKDYAKIKEIYKKSFPFRERKPFGLFLKQKKEGKGELYVALLSGETVGFAIVAAYGRYALLDYFAVAAKERGAGFGGNIFDKLAGIYKNKILILEVEDPGEKNCRNKVQREKRLNFYARHGFYPFKSIYAYGNKMLLLAEKGQNITFAHYCEFLRKVNGEFFYKFISPKELASN